MHRCPINPPLGARAETRLCSQCTATKKGEFAYVCIFHPTMKGTLKIE